MLGAMAQTPVETVPSVCPHDCTSTCALEVERLDLHTIGRVRGSHRNTYTRGVICEKVGRYAERVHHPDRLLYPLRRVGPKGSGRFERIAWDDALDLVAEAFTRQAARLGLETVWPYYYAGTMGLVQRDGINRLTHAMGYSRYFSTICVTLADTGWAAGVGAKRGVDLREIGEHSDLVVIWGGNPVNTQVNVMSHAMQAKRRGATFVVVDPYRTDTAAKADLHLAPRPGTDGALACAIMHVLFAEGLADWDYLRAYTDCPDELAAHVATRTPEWAAANPEAGKRSPPKNLEAPFDDPTVSVPCARPNVVVKTPEPASKSLIDRPPIARLLVAAVDSAPGTVFTGASLTPTTWMIACAALLLSTPSLTTTVRLRSIVAGFSLALRNIV